MNQFIIGILIPLIPAIIAFLLPRRKTIQYGIWIYNILGAVLLQLGNRVKIGATTWGKITVALRKSFVDLAFGIYVASRKKPEDIQKLIDEHLKEE